MNGETTTVVNRRREAFDVYIGRGSPLGNPYRIGPDGERDEVIRKYAYDFPLRFRTEPDFREAVLSCEGKRLGCYCKPEACHGDVIARFLELRRETGEDAALAAIRMWPDCVVAMNSDMEIKR